MSLIVQEGYSTRKDLKFFQSSQINNNEAVEGITLSQDSIYDAQSLVLVANHTNATYSQSAIVDFVATILQIENYFEGATNGVKFVTVSLNNVQLGVFSTVVSGASGFGESTHILSLNNIKIKTGDVLKAVVSSNGLVTTGGNSNITMSGYQL